MTAPAYPVRERRSGRLVRGLLSTVASVGGLAALAQGLGMRFHIENTDEALAEASRGGVWLLGSTCLLGGAVALARWSGAPWTVASLIGLPIVAGVVPAFVLPGNIIPFGTALVSGAVCLGAVIATLVVAGRR